jgi:hypothetical protein
MIAAGIEIVDGFSWTSTSRLTLTARHNIIVKAKVVAAGTGALTLTYGTGNPDSDLLFEQNGKIDFWDTNSRLKINGNTYVLVPDIKTLAADIAENLPGSYALGNDYDAGADGVYRLSPVSTVFVCCKTFEGLGHSIENLTIKHGHSTKDQEREHKPRLYPSFAEERYLGLFHENQGTIRDINLLNVNVSNIPHLKAHHYWHQAALAGANEGTILHAFASGSVSGFNGGGLVGLNDGTIAHSSADVIVLGTFHAGGLVASNWGTIAVSHAIGPVSTKGGDPGGLVGENGGIIDQSYATGSVTGLNYAGGLLGRNLRTVSNSYATGSVSGRAVGGFCGVDFRGAGITTSYSIGLVSQNGNPPRVGGFLGRDGHHSGLQTDYWNIDTSGQQQPCGSKCSGVTGVTDAELKSGLPAGFDPNIWGQSPNINNGYPYLLANPPQ